MGHVRANTASDLSRPSRRRGGGGGPPVVLCKHNKDTSVSSARRDVLSSLLRYRDFITVIAKQCSVLVVSV